jgi:hypothetical protein
MIIKTKIRSNSLIFTSSLNGLKTDDRLTEIGSAKNFMSVRIDLIIEGSCQLKT